MCGIWGFIGQDANYLDLCDSYSNIQPRGPTRGNLVKATSTVPCYMGFHRLAIVEDSAPGDQPFVWEEGDRRIYLGCNGEIYNYKELIKEHDLPVRTQSDCEVILWMYLQYDAQKLFNMLSGEFALFIYDFDLKNEKLTVYLGRDHCGIRPLFYAASETHLAFCSEAKGLTASLEENPRQIVEGVKVFPPRSFLRAEVEMKRTREPAQAKLYFTNCGPDMLTRDYDPKLAEQQVKAEINSKELSDLDQENHKENGKENGDGKKHEEEKHDYLATNKAALSHTPKVSYKISHSIESYYDLQQHAVLITDEEEAKKLIRAELEKAVIDRLHSKAELGCLLSGGLDSSLVSAIAAREFAKVGRKLKTFSIGMPGSTDKDFAEKVARHIGSCHVHVEFSEKDFLGALGTILRCTETFDITTIRATTGQYLISKWVADHTDVKVLVIGDGSDELAAGYMYFHSAPDALASHRENIRLLENIHLYDVLRADRAVAGNGLEARVPFLDKRFIELYLSIEPELRVPRNSDKAEGKRLEKFLMRESFRDSGLLPDEVLYRRKEAFSDGVSSVEKSWYSIIQQWANESISDAEFEKSKSEYAHLPPNSKESLFYRRSFERIFGTGDICKIVPNYWLPLWSGNVIDPSARILKVYNEVDQKAGFGDAQDKTN